VQKHAPSRETCEAVRFRFAIGRFRDLLSDGHPGRSFLTKSLQTLLEGIYSSVLEARRFVNQQHLKLFESYFENKVITDPATGRPTEVYVPRVVAMATSAGVGAEERYQIVEAPAVTLVPLSSLSIDTLEIEFETKLTNLGDVAEEGIDEELAAEEADDEAGLIRRTINDLFGASSEISIMSKGDSFESGASPAKVKVTFKMHDPPEGVSLLQEQMLDYIRK
jgi:hypothetical protein